MNILIYTSQSCPRCKIFKKKLQNAGILYEETYDISEVVSLGYDFLPVIKIDDVFYDMKSALDKLNL